MSVATHPFPGLIILTCCALLAGCAQSRQVEVPPIPAIDVGAPELITAEGTGDESVLLEIGVRIFSNDFDASDDTALGDWVFTEIRNNEAQYLPYQLRNTLTASNQWGAVRVLPDDDPSMDLIVNGTILASDGLELVLRITVHDSTGRLWLDETYRDATNGGDYPESIRFTASNRFDAMSFVDPFQHMYNRISNDLLAVRVSLSDHALRSIRDVSTLVYATDLSPDSFGHTLDTDEQGLLHIVSMPAETDPMLNRARDMRQRHYLFIDRVDEYYDALFDDMQVPYVVWRHYSRDQELLTREADESGEQADFYTTGDSYLALTQRYDRFRWAKIYEQEFSQLASGFTSEVAPAILELNRQVHGLSGTMDEQYRQWRRILRQLFELETGEDAAPLP